jgi:CTP synthase
MSAHSDNAKRMEILEVSGHPFYFAVQYHAEFSSRPGKPEQSFDAFVSAAARIKT